MKKTSLGLLFGFMAGLAFSLTAWLPDALSLSRAHGLFPWLKLGIGSAATLLLFSLAGWVAIHKPALPVTLLCFGLAAILSAWLAGHLPYEITREAIHMMDADLSNHIPLPYHEGAQTRTVLTIILNCAVVVLAAVFFEPLTSQAYLAASRASIIIPLVIFMAFFAFNGAIANYLINQPFSQPLLRMSTLIQEAQEIQNGRLPAEAARDRWVDTLLTLDIDLRVPYRILVREYDTTFTQLELQVQFGQTWYLCNLWEDQPFFCSPVDKT